MADLSLLDEQGQAIPAIPDPRAPKLKGGETGRFFVAPRSSAAGQYVVSQWLAVPRAGTYQLQVRARPPFNPSAPANAAKVFTFKLVVSEADPTRLRDVAESLRQKVVKSSAFEGQAAIEALFSMPPEYAASSWAALGRDLKPEKSVAHMRFFITFWMNWSGLTTERQ